MSNEELSEMLCKKCGDMRPILDMPIKDSEPRIALGDRYSSLIYPDRLEIYSNGINGELVETIYLNE